MEMSASMVVGRHPSSMAVATPASFAVRLRAPRLHKPAQPRGVRLEKVILMRNGG